MQSTAGSGGVYPQRQADARATGSSWDEPPAHCWRGETPSSHAPVPWRTSTRGRTRIAVGIRVAPDSPHGSLGEVLPHTALASSQRLHLSAPHAAALADLCNHLSESLPTLEALGFNRYGKPPPVERFSAFPDQT